jgi:ADP-heptose:LPS heptosyltransferase
MDYLLYIASALVTRLINGLRTKPPRDIRRILVVKLDHLGDVLTALPAFAALRAGLPEAHITALTGPWSLPLMRHVPWVDEVTAYRSPRFFRDTPELQEMYTPDNVHEVFQRGFDIILELRGDWATTRAALRYPPKFRCDRGSLRLQSKCARWLGRQQENIYGFDVRHETVANLTVARHWLPDALPDWNLPVQPEHYGRIAEGLAEIHGPDRGYVLMHPGGSWEYSRWAPKHFAALADYITSELHRPVMFYAGPGETAILDDVLKAATVHHFVFPWPLDIPAWFELTRQAACVVCSDSAQVHMAGLAGVPVVGAFGPTAPERFGPWDSGSAALHHPVPCFPCNRKVCKLPSEPCVNLTTVSEATDAVQRILKLN